MKVLMKGYSGYLLIDKYETLLTSFSLSMSENIIQSGAVGKVLNVIDREEQVKRYQFTRYKLNAVRDYPGYELSCNVDATVPLLKHIFESLVKNDFRTFMQVGFYDDASGIMYEFDECILTSFTLSVPNGGAATMSFSFTTYEDEIELSFDGYDITQGRNAPGAHGGDETEYKDVDNEMGGNLVGDVLMPYWAWGVENETSIGGLADEDLFEFNVSYSRGVTPHFCCNGDDSDTAPPPDRIVLGMPEVKYELTYIVADAADYDSSLLPSDEVHMSETDITIMYDKGQLENTFEFTMTDCYHDSISPSLGNKDDVNKVIISGTVYGRIEYAEDDEGD